MKLMGFNFNKINVEKKGERPADLKVSTNIDVSEITIVKGAIKTKDELVAVKFSYEVSYNPDHAKVELGGAIVLGLEPKLAKQVIKEWKDKKMPAEFQTPLFNLILAKSTVKALELESELNLPFHMPLPSVKVEDKK